MKRILTLMLTIGLMFGLVACGGNDEETPEKETTEESTETTEETEVEEETTPEEEIEEPEEKAEESTSETETKGNSEIADFEEASVIEDEIDVSELDVKVEADNDNKRVILFTDGNRAVYKTIFIKNDQRLKIIDINDNEGQIYNEVIK